MSIYEELGVRPFINAGGWMYTRYGGSIMPEQVMAAMAEASRQFVNIFDLQDCVGERIAALTNNEAAFVSCGAASGILLSVAACIAGTDKELADRLPDTQGMRNQVIMRQCSRGTEADAVVRGAGGKIIQVGPSDRIAGAEDILQAINDQTAAILLILFEGEEECVPPIVAGARERNVPVLVDGACAVPPKENLWRYTRELGADAFITSGGKGIRGPQTTGLVLGTRRIIDGCKYHSSPNSRLGRGMKVGKEEFAGIYTAMKLLISRDFKSEARVAQRQIMRIAEILSEMSGLKLTVEGSQLFIDLDPTTAGGNAESLANLLLAGSPSILLLGRGNRITVRAARLQAGEEQTVGRKLREILAG